MKLIVGLGNPGAKYVGTRHNVGFEVLAELSRRHGDQSPRHKYDGEIEEARIDGEKLLLVAPLTYMNLSGNCVGPLRDFHKVDNHDILIVCDDVNLPVGKLRVRASGSAGGQKGLSHILRRLGDDQAPRLRVGVGSPPSYIERADYVLGKFTAVERPLIDEAVRRAADAAADWARLGVGPCMNQYNADPT